jgi:hypothetical protein
MTEESGFDTQQGQDFFLFSITSRPALGPTQPWGLFPPGANRHGCETERSSPSDASVRNGGTVLHSPVLFQGVVLN